MQIDKDTILELLRQKGAEDRVPEAQQQLPDRVDTDDPGQRGLLERFGLDTQSIQGLLDKLPAGMRDKLPGGLGKLL